MRTINVNLTTEQANLVDRAAEQSGFANRSEFFRAVLRYVFIHAPGILSNLDSVNFEQPPTRDPEYIISELKKSGRYNQKFIESVSRGLRKSTYFKKT